VSINFFGNTFEKPIHVIYKLYKIWIVSITHEHLKKHQKKCNSLHDMNKIFIFILDENAAFLTTKTFEIKVFLISNKFSNEPIMILKVI
jgi:hypothetical protein